MSATDDHWKDVAPITRSKDEARNYYNDISSKYEWLAGRFEKEYRDNGVELLAPKSGECILEVGFGTGDSMALIARTIDCSGQLIGIDLSEKMCEMTARRLCEQAGGARVRLHLLDNDSGESDESDESDESELTIDLYQDDALRVAEIVGSRRVDGAMIAFTLELFSVDEMTQLLRSLRDIVKPASQGGRIVVVALSKGQQAPTMMTRLYQWLHEKFESSFDCRPIFVGDTLEAAQWQVVDRRLLPMYGLEVEACRAQFA
jgi:SAM-dependent methyltransferase